MRDAGPFVQTMNGTADTLALVRRNQSQTVGSSFQLQDQDQFGGQVYKRSNATLGDLATQLGGNAIASGLHATAAGAFAYAREDDSTAFGVSALGYGQRSCTIGVQSRNAGYASCLVGAYSLISGPNDCLVGTNSSLTGKRSIGIGNRISGAYDDSVYIGNGVTGTASNQLVMGSGVSPITEVCIAQGSITDVSAGLSPVTYHASDAQGTDLFAQDIKIAGGRGTGTGQGGHVYLSVAPPGTVSGTTKNALTNSVDISPYGYLSLVSGVQLTTSTKTSSFSVTTAFNCTYFVDSTSGSVTATLPDALTTSAGFVWIFVKKVAANNMVIQTAGGSDVINGAGNITVAAQYSIVGVIKGQSFDYYRLI